MKSGPTLTRRSGALSWSEWSAAIFSRGANEKGTTNLQQEKATQFDVAYDYNSEHFQFSVNPFFNQIKNYVFLSPTNTSINSIPVFNYTQTNAYLYGGEMGVHYHPHQVHWLHISSDISTVFAKDANGNSLPLLPQTKLNTTISTEFSSKERDTKFYLQHIYKYKQTHVGQFETPTNAYSLLNAGASFEFKNKKHPFSVDFGVKNLLNTNYVDHLSRFKKLGIPNQGINFYIHLKINLKTKLN